MKYSLILVPLAGIITLATAQYGPAPPRINIPGAIALPPIREERLLPQQPPQVIRVRRPGAVRLAPPNAIHHQLPNTPTPKFHDPSPLEHKPVTEEPEDDFRPAFIPQLQPHQPSPTPLAAAAPAGLPAQQHPLPDEQRQLQQQQQQPQLDLQHNVLSRFNAQDNRQIPIARAQIPERFFATDKEPIGPSSGGAQRFALERPQPQQPAPKQYRPAPQPQQIARPVAAPPARQHYQDQDQERRPQLAQHQPGRSHSQQEEDRKRKPVAQILRKWREEHEDGSITWGFENDDGSFKEETIGIDCVTRGRYGYVDPDGEKREYNYETGILCDPNRRDEDDDEDNLEVDYQENKAVLPNGVRLNLNNMGKKQSKRPGGEQQQQQQQYYRN
ncbi:mediator of RNA polymerase II transcription subunit 15-like [Anopheles albimanus]|nr:mediator of RNA polymerase II transcription subunit 15-like [Anopheles albimanus]